LKSVKIRVGIFLVTTSFRIYSKATAEWEEWAVDLAVTLMNTLTNWHYKRSEIYYTGWLFDNNWQMTINFCKIQLVGKLNVCELATSTTC